MQMAEYPVKVPTSTALRAPTRRVITVRKAPSSVEICIPAMSPSAAVSAISRSTRSSGGLLWATR